MPETPPELTVGTKVLYQAHLCHATDMGRLPTGGDVVCLFEFEHAAAHQAHGVKEGDPAPEGTFGLLQKQERAGVYRTTSDRLLRPKKAKHAWPATVQAYPDGTLYLEIPHPLGLYSLQYKLSGDCPVVFDATGKQPHSYHLPKEA